MYSKKITVLGAIGATQKNYFEFNIVKWDQTGNKLLEKHKMVVQRQTLDSARSVVRKKYPVREGYFEELNSRYSK
jgi:predicted RNA binding protein with dsRBD fold (UPF0201 family)